MQLEHGYLINLASSSDRLVHAETQLSTLGFATKRVEAVDGRLMAQTPDYDERRAHRYMGRSLSPGELGCYLSHCRALETFLETDEQIALILEDDFRVTPSAQRLLPELLDWLTDNPKTNWQAINLGPNKRKFSYTLTKIGDHELVRGHYFPMLAHAIIWTRAGAENFLAEAKPIFCPADTMIRHLMIRSNQGLAVYPPLMLAGSFESDISDRSGGNRATFKRLPSYGWIKQKRLWTDKFIAMRNRFLAPHGRE